MVYDEKLLLEEERVRSFQGLKSGMQKKLVLGYVFCARKGVYI
jgi:hypothetical protein